ncbi:hypothetical protein PRIPAC_88986 [Pristionchus pacificus]|uniref:Uncharacterized protein n=1 Tax=Pristionchus pacificus TaxID=54126 RepID=A0A454XJK8_PRIPA|nr:hypothetical protein PRIPAC_88986 [Pristionchus pacificus]|eukprot:PDM83327.1 hypothetical protein PRIPAC_34959 [Pristionchus pacificus]
MVNGGFWGIFKRRSAQNADIKKTSLPPKVKIAINSMNKYADTITAVNEAFLMYMQPSFTDCPKANSEQICEDNATNSTALSVMRMFTAVNGYWNREDLKAHADYALFHTWKATFDFQVDGRKALHFTRSFLAVDYANFKENVDLLEKATTNMDQAKAQMVDQKTGEEIPEKKEEYEEYKKEFERNCAEILAASAKLPERQEEHFKEIINFVPVIETYHLRVVRALGWVSKLKNKSIPTPAHAANK